jgi:hypothetical protein
MAGFMSGEGCFFVHTRSTSRTVSIYIKIGQHERDHKLIKSFVEYFGGGRYYKPLNENLCIYICEKFSDIFDNIIPLKKKYPIQGVKAKDFLDFETIANIIKNKAHLTAEGYEQILFIKNEMNKSRKFE